jgi:glycerol-3-phosphate dehydrogenase (NAD(P)+)
MKISILGYGAFGSALGNILALKGHYIYKEEIKDSDMILVAVPSFAVIDVLLLHKSEITNQKIIICSKGFDKNGELFSKVLEKEFPNDRVYFLYGPALADELKDGVFTVMVLAGGEGKEELKKQIEGENLFIELSNDIVGVQVGAALKNTVGIFVGLVEGAGFGQNTQAFVYSKGLQEIKKIGVYLGANQDTFLGLTCVGDLFLRSRNRILGIEIGKGKTYEEVTKGTIYPKEGIDTLNNILKIKNIDLSYFKLIHSIIFEKMSVEEAIKKLVGK